MEKCSFCGSTELVYHQYVICDSACQECGEWQNGDYITQTKYEHYKII